MAYDIQNLRRQQLFQPVDLGYGVDMDYGLGDMQAPTVEQDPFLPPRQQGPLSQIANAPTFPVTEGIQEGQLPFSPVPKVSLPSPAVPEDDLISRVNRVYKPEYTSRDRYNSILGDMPQRDDNISIGRRLVAGGMGLDARQRAGVPGREFTATANPLETMEKVMYAPYIRDMMAWKEKLDPTYKAADLENKSNINERTLAGNIATASWQMDRTEAQRVRDEGKQRVAEQNAESTRIRANAYNYAQRLGKGYQFDVTGPTVKVFNKTTGDTIDTGMETGKLTEEAKIDLQNYGRIEAARVSGEGAAARVAMAGAAYYKDGEGNIFYGNPRDPKSMDLIPAPGSPRTPVGGVTEVGTSQPRATPRIGQVEKNRIRNDKLKSLWQTDTYSKQFIKKSGDSYEYTERPDINKINPRTTNMFGMGGTNYTQQQVDDYDAFRREQDPDYVPPVNRGLGPRNPPTTGAGTTSTATTTTIPQQGNRVPPGTQYGPPTPDKFKVTPQQQKAEEWLRRNGKPTTPANIEAVIKRGLVQ